MLLKGMVLIVLGDAGLLVPASLIGRSHVPGTLQASHAAARLPWPTPTDDYIWQILFAAEDDLVPKRVTAHLHHPPELDDPFLWSHDPPQLQGWQAAPPGLMQPPPPRQPVAHEPLPNGATLLDDVLSKLEPTPLVDLLAWDAARAAAQALPPPRIPPAEQAMAWAAGAAPTPASQDDLPAAAAAGRSAGEGQLEGSAAVAARLPLKLAVEGVPNGVCPGAVALKVEGGAPAAAPPLMANHSPQPAQVWGWSLRSLGIPHGLDMLPAGPLAPGFAAPDHGC